MPPGVIDADALAGAAVETIDRGTAVPLLLICEHASNAIPAPWGDLGVSDALRRDHIAWDIGAGAITRSLSARLGATAILARYSRLFFDCNRQPGRVDAIPPSSDGHAVPGNATLYDDERTLRRRIAFDPLHAAIAAQIDRSLADGVRPLVLAIHSFTPVMAGVRRPWEIGVLWNECDDLAAAMLAALARPAIGGGLTIGANEPYSAKAFLTHSLEEHGRKRALPNAAIEIRNDRIATDAMIEPIAARLEAMLRAVL
jgi:predicted N-formylglutamate amidohydrolase